MTSSRKIWWLFPLIFVVGIAADQILKFYIKLNFTLGEEFVIFDWLRLLFVENPGMAFGVTIGSKMLLTLFRLVVSGVVIWYIVKLIKLEYKIGYLVIATMILTGAVGNIIDCLFYGLIFTESSYDTVAQLTAFGAGYAPCLMGKVVDMFYCPLFTFPDWVPFFGGEIFFSPIFNLADSYITVAIFWLIIGYRKTFSKSLDDVMPKKNEKKD